MSSPSASPGDRVFVSYEHRDRELVRPIVQLLRTGHPHVFFDQDSLAPGKLWRSQIDQAITAARLLIVAWCRHANESTEVRREWELAIQLEKDVMPLLLDATPVSVALAAYEHLDFRAIGGPAHALDVARERRLRGLRKSVGDAPDLEQEARREEARRLWLVQNTEDRRRELERAIPLMASALEAELLRRSLL